MSRFNPVRTLRPLWPAAVVLFAALPALSQELVIPHQGRLLGGSDVPLDTSIDLEVSLWDASAAGQKRWSQAFSSVLVREGLYTVLLGEGGDPPRVSSCPDRAGSR